MAQTARERRAAQRRLAANIKANRELKRPERQYLVDKSIRQAVWSARVNYATRVINGQEPMPAPGTPEAKNLASIASYAAHGQADPRFEAAFSRYWYHFRDAQTPADIEETADYEDSQDDEDTE